MLDPWLQYSCGTWQRADGLEQAQEHKLRLICEKLELGPGQRLLDIGCGWGGLAAYAARHYGVEVVGITLSGEQLRLARSRWRDLPLRFEHCDYRQLEQLGCAPFDRVVSVGMYEHVGPRNAAAFLRRPATPSRTTGCCCCTRSATAVRPPTAMPGSTPTCSPMADCRPRASWPRRWRGAG
jgi:cyclopropane-fatty-acyl-phospholipid synthase